MKNTLSPSEAVFGFAAWLTTRKEILTLSRKHDAAIMAELVKKFCWANTFEEPREGWTDWLVYPSILPEKKRRKP